MSAPAACTASELASAPPIRSGFRSKRNGISAGRRPSTLTARCPSSVRKLVGVTVALLSDIRRVLRSDDSIAPAAKRLPRKDGSHSAGSELFECKTVPRRPLPKTLADAEWVVLTDSRTRPAPGPALLARGLRP